MQNYVCDVGSLNKMNITQPKQTEVKREHQLNRDDKYDWNKQRVTADKLEFQPPPKKVKQRMSDAEKEQLFKQLEIEIDPPLQNNQEKLKKHPGSLSTQVESPFLSMLDFLLG